MVVGLSKCSESSLDNVYEIDLIQYGPQLSKWVESQVMIVGANWS